MTLIRLVQEFAETLGLSSADGWAIITALRGPDGSGPDGNVVEDHYNKSDYTMPLRYLALHGASYGSSENKYPYEPNVGSKRTLAISRPWKTRREVEEALNRLPQMYDDDGGHWANHMRLALEAVLKSNLYPLDPEQRP